MNLHQRIAVYVRQNNLGNLTPAQSRRARKKDQQARRSASVGAEGAPPEHPAPTEGHAPVSVSSAGGAAAPGARAADGLIVVTGVAGVDRVHRGGRLAEVPKCYGVGLVVRAGRVVEHPPYARRWVADVDGDARELWRHRARAGDTLEWVADNPPASR